MKAKPIRAALAAILVAAGPALAQHPPGAHGPAIGPNLPSGLPATPGWPSPGDPFAQQPRPVIGAPSAPGVVENQGTPPLLPPNLAGTQREIPAGRTTTPPASLLRQVVADRIRLTDDTKPPSKLAGVDVELATGGYLVTKKYEDYSSVLPDGRPRYLWEVSYFVGEGDIQVRQPTDVRPDPPRPPSPPFHTLPGTPTDGKPREVVVDPKDPFGLLDPHMDQLRRDAHWRNVVNDGLLKQHIQAERERAGELLSDESIAAMEEIIAAAGWAGLETALTVGNYMPVAGTVIGGGTAFYDQYFKTRDTLLKAGIAPDEAHRRALLQALVVGGVAVGADLATGSVLNKLKAVAKFKTATGRIGEYIDDAARKGRIGAGGKELAKQGVDIAVDNAAVAAGKTTVGTTTAIATTIAAGGFGGAGGSRPAIAQRPTYGGSPYGARFRIP
jgi:hypothetical protein